MMTNSEDMPDLVTQFGKFHPELAPRDLRAWLQKRYKDETWPSAADIGEILERRDIIPPPGRGQPARPKTGKAYADATAPNQVWHLEIEARIATTDGQSYIPVAVTDGFSGICIRYDLTLTPDKNWIEKVLDSAFREFGVPATLRLVNDAPFVDPDEPCGINPLVVWLLRMGIRLERMPAGRVAPRERLRVDLGPQTDWRPLQRGLDYARHAHNAPRAKDYVPSTFKFPGARLTLEHSVISREAKIPKNGRINFLHQRLLISKALWGETVDIWEAEERDVWEVYLGRLLLAKIVGRPPKVEPVPWLRRAHYIEIEPWRTD
jgi:hypothetical protein